MRHHRSLLYGLLRAARALLDRKRAVVLSMEEASLVVELERCGWGRAGMGLDELLDLGVDGMGTEGVGERGSLDTETLGGVVPDIEPEDGRVEEGERERDERDGLGEVVVVEWISSWLEVKGGLLGSSGGIDDLERFGLGREDGVMVL